MKIKQPYKRGKRTICICLNCGELFLELNTRIHEGRGKFCSNDCYKEYRKKNSMNSEELKQRNKEYQKKSKYNLSSDKYNELITNHTHCDICKREFNDKLKPFIDHNHITGKVRGVLCTNCNSVLGHAHDDVDILKNAIEYLSNS